MISSIEILDIRVNYRTSPTTVLVGYRITYDDGRKVIDEHTGSGAIVTAGDNLKSNLISYLTGKMAVAPTIVIAGT